MTESLTFFHAPQTRSLGTAVLLAELGAPHTVHVLNMRAGEQRQPAFLAVNPMGKVPAILHNGALVTEQIAVTIYLADLFPAAGLTPALTDPDRGPYLRWLAFYAGCFEPAIVDRHLKREPAGMAMSPYGTYETMLDTLADRLRASPYIAGDRLTAADILWGAALRWITRFKLVTELPEIMSYVARITMRPSFAQADAEDQRLIAAQAGA